MNDELHAERQRILAENQRRRDQIGAHRYAPWDRAEAHMVNGRRRLAAQLLHAEGVFPQANARCLEIGVGDGGWLPDLLSWGVREDSLHGVEIDPVRSRTAHRLLPASHQLLADGGCLPFMPASFDLVIVSTVLTSVLDDSIRRHMACEIERVLTYGGALLWYDFAVDNPRNPNVRGIPRRQLHELFPGLSGPVRSATLAPPLTRRIAPHSWWLAELLETLPFLRTHLVAVLVRHP